MILRRTFAAALALITIVFATSGYAASQEAAAVRREPRLKAHKVCYIYISGSATRQPCERMNAIAPTTVIPMVVIRYR